MRQIVGRLVNMMVNKNVIEEKQRFVISYGLDLLLTSFISLFSIVFLGFLLNRTIQTLWLMVTFIPLQSFGGGYHCKTHFKCWLLMIIGYLVAIYILLLLPKEILWGGALLFASSFLKRAPVENSKAPLGKIFRKKMKIIVTCIYFVVMIAPIVIFLFGGRFLKEVSASVILSGFSILCASVKSIYIVGAE